MENKVKKTAVEEIMSIYKNNVYQKLNALKSLGQVGGRDAIDSILSIYEESGTDDIKVQETVLYALGEAGKNS